MKIELSAEELLVATKALMDLKYKYQDADEDDFKVQKVNTLQRKLWAAFNKCKRQAAA